MASEIEQCYQRAKHFREEAERIKSWADSWVEEGRPNSTTRYLYNQYCDDDGEAAIRSCLEGAEYQEERAERLKQEEAEAAERREEQEQLERERQAGQEKADQILDAWFNRES